LHSFPRIPRLRNSPTLRNAPLGAGSNVHLPTSHGSRVPPRLRCAMRHRGKEEEELRRDAPKKNNPNPNGRQGQIQIKSCPSLRQKILSANSCRATQRYQFARLTRKEGGWGFRDDRSPKTCRWGLRWDADGALLTTGRVKGNADGEVVWCGLTPRCWRQSS